MSLRTHCLLGLIGLVIVGTCGLGCSPKDPNSEPMPIDPSGSIAPPPEGVGGEEPTGEEPAETSDDTEATDEPTEGAAADGADVGDADAKTLEESLADERRAVLDTMGTKDQREGMMAFIQKRKPVFNQD